jgi:ubiquinone/menaquinone biosynthesis C-methylase UbiE
MSDAEAVKQRQRHVWGLGDYPVIGRQLEPAADALCDACAVSAGQEVLDVAAGDGNFALACAREGASVVASDFTPRMVDLGRARTEAEGYDVEWLEADAESLPFEDGRFDCAGSAFGVFLAPQPEVVAAELFRVVRPGGTVGLTAWTPEGFSGELLELGRRFSPPPDDLPSPREWGIEETVQARLADLAARVQVERRTLPWTAASVEAFAEQIETVPSYVAAKATLSEADFEALKSETLALAQRWNEAADGAMSVDSEYLLVVARKRG